jgi:hypothetical protein
MVDDGDGEVDVPRRRDGIQIIVKATDEYQRTNEEGENSPCDFHLIVQIP